ncbi:transmembrane protein 42 [Eublepharis macularius]|uniref:Transmembrane protein 42 n=1 Tax=Eublepharis macularius TaxID=481883 RepID=A0AA97L9T6_EUBMA|nr:transmembrane protein 42 [Eublepharis macularius]
MAGVWGSAYAAAAGLWGALAACAAKLALGADYLRGGCAAVVGSAAGPCDWLPIILQAGCGGLVIACNAIMWTFFAKALKYSSSSAAATVTSTASNFISSAFLGNLLFGETHALLWWIGISVTLFGLLLLHTAPPPSEAQRHPKEKKT